MGQKLGHRLIATVFFLFWVVHSASAGAEGPTREPRTAPNGLAIYWGKTTSNPFLDHLSQPWQLQFVNSQLIDIAYSRRIKSWGGKWHLEVEANIGYRYGEDSLYEFNATALIRFDGFPWNDKVYTSIAYGPFGPSWVSEIPLQEARYKKTSKILNFMVPEITFAPPNNPNLELLIRIHHRSGGFGLINGVKGASNVVSAGIRFRY